MLTRSIITAIIATLIMAPATASFGQVYLFNNEVEISGSVTTQFSAYTTNSDLKRRDPAGFRLIGNHRITYRGWDIPLNYVLGTYQDRFRQSFNKIGLSPEYKKWLTIHLGFRNVSFSPLTLSGKTFLGAGVEIQRKRLRFGFIAGRFDRAVQADSTKFNLPSFRRNGFAARIGYGTKYNYIDLIYLKGKDNESSLDSLQSGGGISPAENAVLGLRIYQRIIERIYFEFDAALSAFSRDTRVGEVEENESGAGKLMSFFIPPRKSNQYLFGIKSKLEYRYRGITAGIDYDRIEPDFQSMGAYFIRNDIERGSVYTRFSMLKRKLNAFLRYGLQRNNLLRNRSANSLQNMLNITLNHIHSTSWNFRVAYSNYVTRQILDLAGYDDSTLLDQRINNIHGGATHSILKGSFRHVFRANVGYQKSDNKAVTLADATFRSVFLNLMYRISPLEPRWFVAPTFILNSYKSADIPATRYTAGIIAGGNAFDRKLNASVNLMMVFSRRDGQGVRTVFRNTLAAGYRLLKRHSFGLRISFASSKNKVSGPEAFNEFQGELSYTVNL